MRNIGSFKLFGEFKDTGSLHFGGQLPAMYQHNGSRPEGLFLQIEGEANPRKVTYIMGSEAKGWSLCSKGTGPFPTGDGITIEVDLLSAD